VTASSGGRPGARHPAGLPGPGADSSDDRAIDRQREIVELLELGL
jgi:hypothetical protein